MPTHHTTWTDDAHNRELTLAIAYNDLGDLEAVRCIRLERYDDNGDTTAVYEPVPPGMENAAVEAWMRSPEYDRAVEAVAALAEADSEYWRDEAAMESMPARRLRICDYRRSLN